MQTTHRTKKAPGRKALGALLLLALLLPGCTVISVTGTAVGLAASAVVGTVTLVGKGVGAAVDAVSDDPKPDNSGVNIKYSIRDPNTLPPQPAP